MFLNTQVQRVPIFLVRVCICVHICAWVTEFEHRVFSDSECGENTAEDTGKAAAVQHREHTESFKTAVSLVYITVFFFNMAKHVNQRFLKGKKKPSISIKL